MIRYFLFLLMTVILFSCTPKGDKAGVEDAAKTNFTAQKNLVDTIILKKTSFNRQIVTNGKLRAVKKSDLIFKAQGIISEIYVKNGNYIKIDQKVAQLDSKSSELKLLLTKERMEKANLDFADKLIGYGYGRDTATVPADLLRVIKIQSGYNQSLNDLRQSKEDLDNTTLRAPFSGKIANIEGRVFEPNSGVFCTLIDDSMFEVEFSLLESELSYIGVGNTVQVSSFSEPTIFYSGLVTQINPVVDNKGQIKVMAKISNSSGKLMEGMNVKVIAQNLLYGHLVVPKSAVVMRDNFDVLFRLDPQTGKAMWTYVNVVMTNTQFHSVVANKDKNASLNEGDIIIVAGNLNLADGSNVEIKN